MDAESHTPVFKLAPPDVDKSRVVPELRIAVRKIVGLEPSCKVVFDCICEDVFRPKFEVAPGVVRRAKVAVAHACGLSTNTVRLAARELEKRRLVYTTVHWDGLGEMTYWFLVGVAAQGELNQAYDESTGRMLRLARRPKPDRDPGGKFVRRKTQKQAENSKLSNPHGVTLPSVRINPAAEVGQPDRSDGASLPPNGGVNPSGRSVRTVPTVALPHAEATEAPRTKNVVPGTGTKNLDKAYSNKGEQASTGGGKKLTGDRKALADRLEAALVDQWSNDAGKWVNRIKLNPARVERVFADFDLAKREGRVSTTPAQFLEETWQRFYGNRRAVPDMVATGLKSEADVTGSPLSLPPKPKPSRAAPPPQLTEAELVEGGKQVLASGFIGGITERQAVAMLKAGVTLPGKVLERYHLKPQP